MPLDRVRHRVGSVVSRVATLLALLACGCAGDTEVDDGRVGALRVDEILAGDPSGFAVADAPRAFVFPADHGPHPDFRNEWWYVTGSLADAGGRPFGFQVTFFRTALTPAREPAPRTSEWATRQLYMAHLAVTDPAAASFGAHERFARGALGLAGARAAPFRVWLEGWAMEAVESAPESPFPLRVRAGADGDGLDVVLEAAKPPVLQGRDGLSRKGQRPESASYYYSYTRLRATGTIRSRGQEHEVTGTAWLDREWSTSALEPGQVGWDWFALQLEDGRDLMLYLMRRADGGLDPHSSGVLVDETGGVAHLRADDFAVAVLDHWRSPDSGIRYPSRWELTVPGHGLALRVEPLMADQELDLAFRYWEGAVAVTGAAGGRGYVELTGYRRENGPDGPDGPDAPDAAPRVPSAR